MEKLARGGSVVLGSGVLAFPGGGQDVDGVRRAAADLGASAAWPREELPKKSDGSRVKADAILYCTGYMYNFPFLGHDVGIFVDDNRVDPTYKHVFPPHLAPRISFIGLSLQALQFPVFQLQSNWVARVLSGRSELPSQEEMMEDMAAFYSELEARGCLKIYAHDLGECTYESEDWVADQCRLERIERWMKEMFVH
ncbi:flavin-containing monooxygenase FMO GS-OX-like 2 [Lolium perenne]|uniref:flavin-containing monooxygenase FMO GS-OX-like 2 n=1 Tax=Lolium perenne TaxID=4522 RepID=UPI0021F5EFA7|nr:flavin-containing monooxygenase FMO GS-OX-like 2 [Lolium perenne]